MLTIDMTELTIPKTLYILLTALALGFLISIVFRITHRKSAYEPSFITTIIILPVIISMIIVLVNNDIARAFSLAGIFTLVRFRMSIHDSKDISYILTTVAVGLGLSIGYITITIIVVVFTALVLLIIYFTNWEKRKTAYLKLKILVPENINYYEAFEKVFNTYLVSYKQEKMKTTDLGSLFELSYIIVLKDLKQQKAFVDELRIINGNLTINIASYYGEVSSI